MKEPRSISYAEYLQFLGLMALAERHTDTLKGIEHAIQGVLGVDDDWACDAVYSGVTADEFLNRLNIAVLTQ